MSCHECRRTWAAHDDTPPCEGCHPGVHEYNAIAYEVWGLAGDQFIWQAGGMGQSSPAALLLSAIVQALEILDVDSNDRLEVTREVKQLGSIVINKLRDRK